MAQELRIEQVGKQEQRLQLTPQQLLSVRLLELPVVDLEERVKVEMLENETLEEGREKRDDEEYESGDYEDGYENDDSQKETEADMALGDYAPDDVPSYLQERHEASLRELLPIGDTVSFLDDLMSQLMDFDLTEHQRELVEYLIGSLDDNGFIDQSISRIVDDMEINHGFETDEKEVEEALHILQSFDPAGIGARDYRECLLLQIDRKLDDETISESKRNALQLERRIISDEYEAFENRNVDRLADNLSVDKKIILQAFDDIRKLNLHPGLPLSESSSDRMQTAIPDFIIETDGEGVITMQLNSGDVPPLRISEDHIQTMLDLQKKGDRMTRAERQGLQYYKSKIDRAQMFIDAIRQRQQTLTATMQSIISLQRKFFLTQDDDDLNSLILKDVAEKAHLDISTVSRVCKSKYALIDGCMYPLTYFFKHHRKNSQGEEVDSDRVGVAIQKIVDAEDKNHPYSDDQIVVQLKKIGINVARRTVNKYRAELAIPTASKRKR